MRPGRRRPARLLGRTLEDGRLEFASGFGDQVRAELVDENAGLDLLDRAFAMAVSARAESPEQVLDIRRKQLTGIAGLAAERLARALSVSADEEGALTLLALHPLLNPAAYVSAELDATLLVRPGPADEDGAWISLCGPTWPDALRAIARAAEPHLDVEVISGPGGGWRLSVVRRDEELPEDAAVAVTRFSTGAGFAFHPRPSLPITPV